MPERKKSSRSSSSSRGSSSRDSSRTGPASRGNDAIALLKADHAKVLKLFEQFDKASTDAKAASLAEQICMELKVHTTLEEEIFYPEARAAIDDDDLLDEAAVEHDSAKELIEQIESGSPADEKWCAKVTVLGEYIRHHVKEEQNELFPEVRKADVDLKAMGDRMIARKKELLNGRGKVSRSRKDIANEGRRDSESALNH